MSDALILPVVAKVCVTIGGPVTLTLYFGRAFSGRATTGSIEVATGTDSGDGKPNGK